MPNNQITPGLLRTNKVIHAETSSLLYGKNSWVYDFPTPDHLISFCDQIGSTNTGYILYFRIHFPLFHRTPVPLDDGSLEYRWSLRIDDGAVGIFQTLQSRCTNLSTLGTSFNSTRAMEDLFADAKVDHKDAAEALKLVNLHSRAISSVKEIVLEAWEKDPNDPIRQEMKALGWTIHDPKLDNEEWAVRSSSVLESDDDYGDGDDNDYGYSNDDDDEGDDDDDEGDDDDDEGDDDDDEGDDYDLDGSDNDGEIWRHADD